MLAFIEDKQEMREFVLAGNGARNSKTLFTLTNNKTGKHFTFKVRRKNKTADLWFVSFLSGPDNTYDYSYLGIIRGENGVFTITAKSPSKDAMSVKAFDWFFNTFLVGTREYNGFTFNHENHCCRCGRLLTVDTSVRTGYGPKCARMAA